MIKRKHIYLGCLLPFVLSCDKFYAPALRVIAPILLLTTLQACRRSCMPNFISPVFVGFAPGDVDTFVIREYQPNSNFLDLVDTVLMVKNGSAVYTASNDTVITYFNISPPKMPIRSGYDWQIYIPSKNRTITLTDIVDVPREGSGRVCLDSISSFKLDGRLVVPHAVITDRWYTSGYFAYITNN